MEDLLTRRCLRDSSSGRAISPVRFVEEEADDDEASDEAASAVWRASDDEALGTARGCCWTAGALALNNVPSRLPMVGTAPKLLGPRRPGAWGLA